MTEFPTPFLYLYSVVCRCSFRSLKTAIFNRNKMRSFFLLAAAGLASSLSVDDLYLENAPSSPRPYIIPHYADSHSVYVGSQVYRFPVTGPSSDYAFTLMSTNAPASGSLGVLPHIHQAHYENFFNFKGRFQLWAQKDDAEQQGRLLTQGDYGSVPRNTTHTFQILDPDTEMVGVVVPGGFEYVPITTRNAFRTES